MKNIVIAFVLSVFTFMGVANAAEEKSLVCKDTLSGFKVPAWVNYGGEEDMFRIGKNDGAIVTAIGKLGETIKEEGVVTTTLELQGKLIISKVINDGQAEVRYIVDRSTGRMTQVTYFDGVKTLSQNFKCSKKSNDVF